MEDLIATNQEDGKIGGFFALFKTFDPPANGNAGINRHMEQAQGYATRPSKHQAQQNRMDTAMHPGCGMCQPNLVDGHPFVLEQPVRNQVKHQGGFERIQAHGIGR